MEKNPSPVDMVNVPLLSQGFIHPRWLAGFLPLTCGVSYPMHQGYNGQLNGLNLATAFHRLARCTNEHQFTEVGYRMDQWWNKDIGDIGILYSGILVYWFLHKQTMIFDYIYWFIYIFIYFYRLMFLYDERYDLTWLYCSSLSVWSCCSLFV